MGATKYSIMPLGIRVVDVKAVELSISGQVNSGLTLGVEDDPGGINDGLFGWKGSEPVGHGVGSDRGGQDFRVVGKGSDCIHARPRLIRCVGSFKLRA